MPNYIIANMCYTFRDIGFRQVLKLLVQTFLNLIGLPRCSSNFTVTKCHP